METAPPRYGSIRTPVYANATCSRIQPAHAGKIDKGAAADKVFDAANGDDDPQLIATFTIGAAVSHCARRRLAQPFHPGDR